MYTIISATHRPGSNTRKVAEIYLQILKDQGIEAQILSLQQLPESFLFTDTFGKRTERFQQIIDQYLIAASKLVIIAPEYNGGMPGIFSSFMDAIEPEVWVGKKVTLVGIASGRGGNSRGLDYQSNCFHYMGVQVYHHFIPISRILTLLDAEGQIQDQQVLKSLKEQAEGFISY
jgi:chromate reductase